MFYRTKHSIGDESFIALHEMSVKSLLQVINFLRATYRSETRHLVS